MIKACNNQKGNGIGLYYSVYGLFEKLLLIKIEKPT